MECIVATLLCVSRIRNGRIEFCLYSCFVSLPHQSTKFTLRADRNLNVSENELSLLVHSNVHMRSLHDMQLTATDSIAAHTDGNMSLTSRASDFSSANAITLQAAVLALRSGLCSNGGNATSKAACEESRRRK